MNKNYLLSIEYDGTRYSGWQRQGNTDNTIESKISNCLKLMCGGEQEIEIHGSGRTDAGVHARAQMANVRMDTDLKPEAIKGYLNNYLPEDIKINHISLAEDRFHARLSAVKKTYSYTIDMGDKANVFLRKFAWNTGYNLDISKMKEASKLLVGKKDFRSLSDMKSNKSSVRTIYTINISQKSDIITIEYTGDGFLYHMVRKITAMLVEVGADRIQPCQVIDILDKKDNKAFKLLAPAKGLCLEEVFY